MGKPRLIILIRHAQSEGNKNRDIHQTIPDHRVKLTQEGWQQAYDAGRRLRKVLRADDTLHFYTSPYRRTRETTEGILQTLTGDEPDPSPFKRNNIKVYEEPRLREQDFGNFQPCSAEMERMWQERADYGHFFYRIPNGESAADAYDRVSGFNESLWRSFGEDDCASVCVLVTHGLMSRVFLMKWYHFSVEYFEDLRNVNHCEFLIMRKQENGKYLLQNKLRTWSELRRERALLKEKERERDKDREGANGEKAKDKESSKLERTTTSPVMPRKWGGCPHGCDHGKHFRIRPEFAELVQSSEKQSQKATFSSSSNNNNNNSSHTSSSISTATASIAATLANGNTNGHTIVGRRPGMARRFHSFGKDDRTSDEEAQAGPHVDVTRALEELVSSPDGTPSFISAEDRLRSMKSPDKVPMLHVGRDFGGTYSGHTSAANSEGDSSEDDGWKGRGQRVKISTNGEANGEVNGGMTNGTAARRDQSGMGRHTKANRLGDAPHSSDTSSDQDEDLGKAEEEDKSIEGSIY